ncbi:tRNA wybutosine-synthesizing protein 2 [Tolypocladium ophioglossoides CBS 100239]|uniref:tRNA wybutosine-synthesizing protein 2 n=1 Tax=Tolypocladium ophioglossoides (strain CBS 100239) TaxID=1163406 RepID=A0A0L0NK11_TOLOC|nr:tRNA wybutosine-synthesizing protein 2 [Tolypocladium ophioglossoides CBS 100239]
MPKPRRRQTNPIQAAVDDWITSLGPPDHDESHSWREALLSSAPKRFTIYEPMAVLPSGSFTSPPWATELDRRGADSLASLWSLILRELSKNAKATLTNLAVNEGIPLHNDGQDAENIRRSPSALRMLLGDFGPAQAESELPSQEDFDKALWVSTKQNGIFQTWAPRWTMFSRGNVKEKARLLQFPSAEQSSTSPTWATADVCAVDLYAGIGYFVFCYASLGMRVLCWEINPWSVEGLRRGARANRWTVKVVHGQDLELPLGEVVSGDEQIIVFLEANEGAPGRIKELQRMGLAEDVRHVNCGFLPSSEPTWEAAGELTRLSSDSWLHLHENVGVDDIEARRQSIQSRFVAWSSTGGQGRSPAVEHVELVKTFAPGIWHCVFDVHFTKSIDT